VKHNRDANK